MANACILMIETHLPISMTCDNAVGIAKGTIVKLSDPLTCAASAADEDVVAGITAEEKIASDGNTRVSVYRGGVFLVTAEGTISAGDALSTGTATGSINAVQRATKTSVSSKTIGLALEDATDAQTLMIELRPGCTSRAYS